MVMELKMVNPVFMARKFTLKFAKDVHYYRLWFEGWNGIGNIDGNGEKYFYLIECDDVNWNCANVHAHGYSWFFSKINSDGAEMNADFSNTEIEIIIHTMLEAIKNGGIY